MEEGAMPFPVLPRPDLDRVAEVRVFIVSKMMS